MKVSRWLEHPLARGRDLDDPRTTDLRRRILASKPFLRAVFDRYRTLAATAPADGIAIELGSGAGFLEQFRPRVVKTDVQPVAGIDAVVDAHWMPFADASASAVLMTNAFHHFRRPAAFLRETARVLRPGGALVMIEPWPSTWSRLVYRHLHHERFDERAATWDLPGDGGPLTAANGALPWIVRARDRTRLSSEVPELQLESILPMMPFRYLLSGGMSGRSLMPGWTSGAWRFVERCCAPVNARLAMFACVVLRRL